MDISSSEQRRLRFARPVIIHRAISRCVERITDRILKPEIEKDIRVSDVFLFEGKYAPVVCIHETGKGKEKAL